MHQHSRCHSAEWNCVTIPRLGRFGIGVLSAFLLGSTIEVTTRYYTSSKGYRFSISKNGGIPDIEIVDCPVGTEITIDMQSHMKYFDSSSGMLLFPNGDKYHYVIPRYPFTYPVCLFSVDYIAFRHERIYYYNENDFLNELDSDTVKIFIGSLLDTNTIVVNDNWRDTRLLFNSLKSSPCLPEDNFTYKRTKILDNTNYYNQDKNIEYNFVSIEKIYYNGMLIKVDIPKLSTHFDEFWLIAKPLYAKIDDYDCSASINLKKTTLYDGKALHKLLELNSFLLIMIPLVVEAKYLEAVLIG